jgi:predicted amidophosphoribosyltransferase
MSSSAVQPTGRVSAPQGKRHRIANRPVLLIDDVMTTNATLYEAAETLHRA